MIFGIIFVGISLIFLIITSVYSYNTNECSFGAGFICGASIIILLIVEILMIKGIKPKAIDVYRGKTELNITSVNGVPTDTVVVWKEVGYINQ